MTHLRTSVVAARAQVARPLKVVIPLIQHELDLGNAAGLEHYRCAGELLLEVRAQVASFRWTAWLRENFALSQRTAYDYMTLAELVRADPDILRTSSKSLFSIVRAKEQQRRKERRAAFKLHHPVDLVDVVGVDRDRARRRELAYAVLDAGYKAHAQRLHPDRGGDTSAMARLNQVRDHLKALISRSTW